MAEYTKNLNLEKPDYGEYYDIGTFNANADKIDKGIEDSENRSTQRLEVHKDSNDHTADKIRYSGKVGKDNVKDAIDEVDTRVDNIVVDGGNGNAEVVDARHSTTKDKTYNTLKGRLEDSEQDIEKLKTDTSVAESVTETSYDSVIPVPDSAINGQVSGVMRGLTATNLVENGDFRDGINNWRAGSAVDTVSDNTLINTGTGSAYYPWTNQLIDMVPSNKHYFGVKVKPLNPDCLKINLKSTSTTVIENTTVQTQDTWYYLSGVALGGDRIQIQHVYSDTVTAEGKSIAIKEPILVDLTATFGAGNEPTKEECDQIFANYFDGTKSTIGSARISSADDTGEVKDKAYVTAVKDGKIVDLKSLPNGVRDEINISYGKAIIRIKEHILQSNDICKVYKDYDHLDIVQVKKPVDSYGYNNWLPRWCILSGYKEGSLSTENDIGNFGTTGNKVYIEVGFPKGTTLEQAREQLVGTKLIYQLAEPEIIPVRWTGIQAYEGGTVYVDTVIPELGFYYNNGLESHYPDQPIKEVDTLYRVDKETGYKEPLDTSLCAIAEDRLSFTHPDLVDGDLCDWDYVPMTESTRPETTFEFPTNLKASVNSLLDAEQINKKEHNIFKTRLDNHDRDIERIDDGVDSVRGEIDTHKADKNNPHSVTPQQIGAETPSGAQAKANVVQRNLDTHKNQGINDNVHGLMGSVIVDSGSNENGEYVKFGDATMVCWNKCRLEHTGNSKYLSTVWQYPQPFVEDPTLCLTRTPPTDTSIGIRDFGILAVTSLFPDRATLAIYISSSVNKNFSETDYTTCSALAIGRWK